MASENKEAQGRFVMTDDDFVIENNEG